MSILLSDVNKTGLHNSTMCVADNVKIASFILYFNNCCICVSKWQFYV